MEQAPALAHAADVLSDQLQAQIQRLARLVQPHAAALERRFLQRLRRLQFDPKQRKALAAITPGAAASILAREDSPAAFFEQVEYNGRRLAKFNLPPSRIISALREYDSLLERVFRSVPGPERANLRWACEQLQFSVILTLNNAFYQVREDETQAYQELFRAELESGNLQQLLSRMIEILSRFCRAGSGVLFLLEEAGDWVLRAETGAVAALPVRVPNTAARFHQLSQARCRSTGIRRLALDARWHGVWRTCWSVPLSLGGRVAGVMQFGFRGRYEWLPRELALLSAAAERCLLAAEKARLVEDLAAREEQVRRLAGHMLEVEERERKRISSELHDEAGQSLLCIRLQLEMLEAAADCPKLRSGLAETRALTERSILEIRRLIADLSPAVLAQLGLPAALRQLASRVRRVHKIHIRLQLSPLSPLPARLATVVYRLVQECANNIARHAFASRVNVFVSSTDRILRLRVEDNGIGFNLEEALTKRESFGLAGMRERVALLGGKFHVQSRPGRGTKVVIELPLPEGKEP